MSRVVWVVGVVLAWGSCGAAEGEVGCKARVEAKLREAERLHRMDELDRAAARLRTIITELEAHPCPGAPFPAVLTRLGHVLQHQGNPAEAERIYRKALEIRGNESGAGSAEAASSLSDIATSLIAQGRMQEAEELLRRAVDVLDSALGPSHYDTLVVRNNLGVFLLLTGQPARAEPVLRRVTAGLERIDPQPREVLMTAYQNLAAVHFTEREPADAERYVRMHLELAETGGLVSDIAIALSNLIVVHTEQQRFEEAERLIDRAMRLSRIEELEHIYAGLLISRGAVRKHQKRYPEAAADLRTAISLLENAEWGRAPSLAEALRAFASVLKEQKLKNESRAVNRRLRELLAEHTGELWADSGAKRRGFLISAHSPQR